MSEPETARPWDQVPERFQAVRRSLQAAREWLSGAAGRVTTVRSLRATRGSGVRSCNSGAFPADSAVSEPSSLQLLSQNSGVCCCAVTPKKAESQLFST